MNHTKKQNLFKNFLTEWDQQFNKLPGLEQLLQAYPLFQDKMDKIPIIKSHELEAYQLE